jgi:hypothetical protein
LLRHSILAGGDVWLFIRCRKIISQLIKQTWQVRVRSDLLYMSRQVFQCQMVVKKALYSGDKIDPPFLERQFKHLQTHKH